MNFRVTATELERRHILRRTARHLALDISIFVGALLLWALLSHLPWYQLWKPNPADDCVYLGRAGAHCAPRANKDGDVPAQRICESLRRAGRSCTPEWSR